MENYITISSCRGAKVGVKTSSEDSLEFLINSLLPPSQIPQYKIKLNDKNYLWEIFYEEGKPILEFDLEKKDIRYRNVFGMTAKWDITNIASQILISDMLKENNLLTFHASAFSKEGKNILIPGPPLAGKTTLLLYSIYKEKADFLSSEKTVVDENYIIGGTNMISVDKQTIERFVPELYEKIENQSLKDILSHNKNKINISLEKNKYSGNIDLILFPKVTLEGNIKEYAIKDNKKKFLLLDNLSNDLKNLNYLLDFKDSFPNLLKRIDRENILSEIEKLKDVPTYFIEGNPKEIYDRISELI